MAERDLRGVQKDQNRPPNSTLVTKLARMQDELHSLHQRREHNRKVRRHERLNITPPENGTGAAPPAPTPVPPPAPTPVPPPAPHRHVKQVPAHHVSVPERGPRDDGAAQQAQRAQRQEEKPTPPPQKVTNYKTEELVPPDIVLIVPYRNRKPHLAVFVSIMPRILEGKNYRVWFIHQSDARPFNRGALKNIGFIILRRTYPKHYKQINVIFHDIDFMPYQQNQFSYTTTPGTIRHFYGYPDSLGGIFAIKGADFEKTNGFPNFWTWGLEDNLIYHRAKRVGLRTDYREFTHAEKQADKVIGLWHGWNRLINPKRVLESTNDTGRSGISSVHSIKMEREKLGGPVGGESAYMFHVTQFSVGRSVKYDMQGATMANSRLNKWMVVKAHQEKMRTLRKKASQRRHYLAQNPNTKLSLQRRSSGNYGSIRGIPTRARRR